jgi:hypothetical protein
VTRNTQGRHTACAVAPSLPDTLADCARPPAHSQHHFTMPENSASSTAHGIGKISGIVRIMRMLCSRCTCLAQPVEAGVNQLAVAIMQQERKWATVDVEAVHDQERSRTCSCGVPELPPAHTRSTRRPAVYATSSSSRARPLRCSTGSTGTCHALASLSSLSLRVGRFAAHGAWSQRRLGGLQFRGEACHVGKAKGHVAQHPLEGCHHDLLSHIKQAQGDLQRYGAARRL